MTRFSDIAATLSRAGYRPIPIKTRDKAPAVAGWTDYAFVDADRQRFADAGVGLLCGELRAIDIDVRNEEVSTRLSQLAAQMLWPGSKAPRRIGQWPKTLFMVRSESGPKMSTAPYLLSSDTFDNDPHKVEILGQGQQFVAYGIHPHTGREYQWNGAGEPVSIRFEELPYVAPELLRQFVHEAEQVLAEFGTRCGTLGRQQSGTMYRPAGDLRGDVETVRSAVRHIPNNNLSRDDWVVMGHAIKGALGEDGRDLWLEWSRSCDKSGKSGASDTPERAWESFTPQRIGAGTIYFEATRNGWKRPSKALPEMPADWDEVPPPEVPAEVAQAPRRNHLDWSKLALAKAPKFEWIWQDWLSWHPTLLAGRGGIGKSLFAQQLATALATCADPAMRPNRPVRVLLWACEDDQDELWRRQERICAHLGLTIADLGDSLVIDARMGLDNTLYTMEYGRPMWTPLIGELTEQVNDLQADVVLLDNIAQLYGANENERHHVTTFTNGIAGLVRGRPFCPIFLGHPAKAAGSEYAGSGAWENAVRMRWLLSDRLPDEPEAEEGEVDNAMRFLCKRKSNYSMKDIVRLRIDDGVLKPVDEQVAGGDSIEHLWETRAENVTLAALDAITRMGKTASEQPGPSYLPKLVMEFGYNESLTKAQVERAMRRLLKDGKIRRDEVGRYANRAPKFGLVRV